MSAGDQGYQRSNRPESWGSQKTLVNTATVTATEPPTPKPWERRGPKILEWLEIFSLFISNILLMLVVITTPVIRSIYLFGIPVTIGKDNDPGLMTFGTLGYCVEQSLAGSKNTTCSSSKVLYVFGQFPFQPTNFITCSYFCDFKKDNTKLDFNADAVNTKFFSIFLSLAFIFLTVASIFRVVTLKNGPNFYSSLIECIFALIAEACVIIGGMACVVEVENYGVSYHSVGMDLVGTVALVNLACVIYLSYQITNYKKSSR